MSELNINICRFCLCRCENYINMLSEENFIEKTKDVFYKLNLEISEGNGLPVIMCVVCYNTIAQFHAYFLSVAENQAKLKIKLEETLLEVEIRDESDEEWIVTEEIGQASDIGSYIEVNEDHSYDHCRELSGVESVAKRHYKRHLISDEWIERYKEGEPLEPSLKEKMDKNYVQLFICDFCTFYTFSNQRMMRHVLKCKDTWNLPPKVQASYRMVPTKEMLTIPCPLCPPDALKMKNERILELHLKEHADYDRIDRDRLERGHSPLIKCPRCERRLRTEVDFYSHIKKHNDDELMTCELCGRTLVASNLRSHLRNHFKTIICEFCSKVFKNPSGLQKHINAKHSGPEFFQCDQCNTKIRRAQKFQEHLAVCRGPGTVWPCTHCGETFESISHRHYHVKKFHLGYKCKMCGIEVKSVTQLKHHYKSQAHKQRSHAKREEMSKSKLMKGKVKEISGVLKRK